MELSDIVALLEHLEHSSIQRLELQKKDFSLTLDKSIPGAVPAVGSRETAVGSPVPVKPAPAPVSEGRVVKAPLVGTFYAASAPDTPPLAPVGSVVKKGQTLCILEAMKMMSEVPAPDDGVIAEVLVSDGELVGFDQPLFRLK